ncbi:MAG TPA: cytochrome c [Thioalkalivibrio sp.]|nr:cytochrome c [Thioalkalivibrio sp.]
MIRKLILTAALLALAGTAQAAGDPMAGRDKSQTCQACHGADGNNDNPMYPKLAGQYESYLLRALLDYKSGDRNNAIMAGMVAGLSEQDMADLAAYYARQKGLFNTVPD